MERPTWKNTLHGEHGALIVVTAQRLGYLYFCLDGKIYPTKPNGMYGSYPEYPVCTEGELDSPWGVNWWNGARPCLTAARRLTEALSGTLQDLVNSRLTHSAEAVIESRQSEAADWLGVVLKVLDDKSVRGSATRNDPDGSIAAVRAAVVEAKAAFS